MNIIPNINLLDYFPICHFQWLIAQIQMGELFCIPLTPSANAVELIIYPVTGRVVIPINDF
jgi:hypothetical protein